MEKYMKSKLELLKKEFSINNFKFCHTNYLDFYLSQWQKNSKVNLYYVAYRVLFALVFLISLIISIVDLDNIYKSAILRAKWFIYLTNWHYTICTVQATMSACMVLYMYLKMRKFGEYMQISYISSIICNLYWALYTIAINGAVLVSLVYWVAVYDPKVDPLSIVNIFTHAINAVMLLFDSFIIAHSVRLLHFYLPICFNTIYVGFTVLYYLFDGTDKHGRPYIYAILNWQRPKNTMANLMVTLCFIFFLHCVIYLLIVLRQFLARNLRQKEPDQASFPLNTKTNYISEEKDIYLDVV